MATRAPAIPMNDFHRQWADTEEAVVSAVKGVGESGWYILGKSVTSFEEDLRAYLGRGHAVGCANGMDAIEIALRALHLRPGQRVLTTPLSAFATTLAILRAGGVPVFVDVDASGLVDLDLVEAELRKDSTLRFFVPVHLYGHALDLRRLENLQRTYGLSIVEDMCQAIGARSGGRPVGSVGRLSAISFYPTKNLGALGDGGAIVTDDAELAAACRTLRDYGQSGKYVHDVQGLNSRLDELHAAILGRVFLPRLTVWTQRRSAIADAYRAGLSPSRVTPLPPPRESASVWHLFPVRVRAAQRAALREHLSARGIQSAIHYPALIPDQKALPSASCEVRGDLKNARDLTESELSLPIHPYLTDDEAARVIEAVNAWAAA